MFQGSPFATYDALVALAGRPEHAGRVSALLAAFSARTGAFSAEQPWYERRSRAFWDDALTSGGLAVELASELGPDRAAIARATALATAHRGIYELAPDAEQQRVRFEDLWSGAVFFVTAFDEGTRAGIFRHEGGLCDGRLVADAEGAVSLLPGAFFHPEDATPAVRATLDEARRRQLGTHALLDALLLMEHRLLTLSRVKASFAYRLPPAR